MSGLTTWSDVTEESKMGDLEFAVLLDDLAEKDYPHLAGHDIIVLSLLGEGMAKVMDFATRMTYEVQLSSLKLPKKKELDILIACEKSILKDLKADGKVLKKGSKSILEVGPLTLV